jgi:hypothetical protein
MRLSVLTFYTSLLVLLAFPAMLIGYASNTKPAEKMHCLRVTFPANHSCEFIPEEDVVSQMRDYTIYRITKDSLLNAAVFPSVRNHFHRMYRDKDTVKGIRIILAEDALFEDFIQCVSILKEHKPSVFLARDYEIYALYVHQPFIKPRPSSGCIRI